MSLKSQIEREEEALERDLRDGRITTAEYWKEIRGLQQDYRAAAREAAREAYENEIERWNY